MNELTLKQWRLAKEISQERMAQMCGVHRNTYASWEDNPNKMPIFAAAIVAKALGVGLDAIIFLPDNSTNL